MRTRQSESRLLPALAVVALVSLLALLPGRFRIAPEWYVAAGGAAFLIPMVAAGFAPVRSWWAHAEHYILAVLVTVTVGIEVLTLARLLADMLVYHRLNDPMVMIASAVSVWVSNVVIFALAYWQLDRGGPDGRATGWSGWADLSFPRGDPSDGLPATWHPAFADYLFLAFSTSTAFSTTDTIPLRSRTKALMMLQALISMVTLVVVAARAINILK